MLCWNTFLGFYFRSSLCRPCQPAARLHKLLYKEVQEKYSESCQAMDKLKMEYIQFFKKKDRLRL